MKPSSKKIGKALLEVLERVSVDQHVPSDKVAQEIIGQLNEKNQYPLAIIYTARPLKPALRKRIESFLKKRVDTPKVSMTTKVDPKLLGGFIAKVGDQEFDFSVRSALKRIRTYA